MARPLDPRESPWHRKAHGRDVRTSVPREIEEQFERAVLSEKHKRGKFSKSAALREALAEWLSRR